jgi:hypothetical protein
VFAIVRNVAGAKELQNIADSAPNVIVLRGDLTDNESLKVGLRRCRNL